MKITKVRDVKTPERGTPGSAGIDFFVPNDFKSVFMHIDKTVNIPSGIHVKVPKGFALIAMNKSGVALKKGLQVGACVIDEDYQGEVHLHVTKIAETNGATIIKGGDKLVQFLLVPVSYEDIEIVEGQLDLYTEGKTERGTGAFGSTD